MDKAKFFQIEQIGDGIFLVKLDIDHIIFKSHFPEFPILPGSCIAEIIRSACVVMLSKSVRISKVNSMKFIVPIRPETQAAYHLYLSYEGKGGTMEVKSTIRNGTIIHCKAVLTLTQDEHEC